MRRARSPQRLPRARASPRYWPPINSIDPVEGPATVGTVFGVGPPQPAGRYTFHCTVHPQMTGAITVEAG